MYSLGVNESGQLGRDPKSPFGDDPAVITALKGKGVKNVAAGADFSLFLTYVY